MLEKRPKEPYRITLNVELGVTFCISLSELKWKTRCCCAATAAGLLTAALAAAAVS